MAAVFLREGCPAVRLASAAGCRHSIVPAPECQSSDALAASATMRQQRGYGFVNRRPATLACVIADDTIHMIAEVARFVRRLWRSGTGRSAWQPGSRLLRSTRAMAFAAACEAPEARPAALRQTDQLARS